MNEPKIYCHRCDKELSWHHFSNNDFVNCKNCKACTVVFNKDFSIQEAVFLLQGKVGAYSVSLKIPLNPDTPAHILEWKNNRSNEIMTVPREHIVIVNNRFNVGKLWEKLQRLKAFL